MKTRSLTLPTVSAAEISVSHVDLDAGSTLNHNESHIHSACEIYLNLSGDVVFEVENRIYPIHRGSVIITRPYEYHHCIYLSEKRHEHFWITFSAAERDEFLKMFFSREKGKDNLILLDEKQLESLCRVLEGLLRNEMDRLQQRIDFLRIFQILSAGKSEEHTLSSSQLPGDVALALRFMDDHLAEELDMGAIAAACSVSVTTLERHFKDAFHSTPFAMLRKKRLFCSMEHLRKGDSVAEAALKSGFSDYSNYIQLFKKQFGITPLCYKKKFEFK